jgi:WS/DGAT/MGAT family acyltransferase
MARYERLSALDASFLGIEDESTHMHVGAIMVFEAAALQHEDGGLDIERIRALVASRLHCVPRYRQRLAYVPLESHPVWVDDRDFNLQYHVRHTSLPRPGDERLLKRLAGRIMSQKLDPGKPLWEMWFVEGLDGPRFALITKTHHCMIDGISAVDVLAALLRTTPDTSIEKAPAWQPRHTPSRADLLAGAIGRRITAPFALAGKAREALRDPRAAATSTANAVGALGETLAAGLRPADPTPLNPEHIGPHRRFDTTRMDRALVDEIRGSLGGTINDVALAVVAGGLRRFLLRRGVRVSSLDFRVMLPVSVRSREERGKLGNRVAMLIASLPVNEPDPRDRLQRVVENTSRLKRSRQVHGAELLEEIGDWTADGLVTRTVRLAARIRSFNLVVTNVPGPRQPFYLLGARLLEPYPVVPLYSNQALGVALISYDQGLYWGLNADWDQLPDLHDLLADLEAAFEELCSAAGISDARAGQPENRGGLSPRERGPAHPP